MNYFNGNELIINGKLIESTIKSYELSVVWVMDVLKNSKVNSIEEVQYAEIQLDGDLYLETDISK